MAKTATAWETRRALTDNPKSSPEEYGRAADALMGEGLTAEAASFYRMAGNKDGLTKILNQAVAEGNFFIFKQVAEALGPEAVDSGLARQLADNAERAGLIIYAEKAKQYPLPWG